MKATTPHRSDARRPYAAPVLQKQSNLKSITLFTDFGSPDRSSGQRDDTRVRDAGIG